MKRRSYILLSLFFSFNSFTVQPQVLAIDFDDVMSIKSKVGFVEFAPLIARMVFWHPSLVSLLMNFNEIKSQGEAIGRSVDGASNVIHALAQKLKEQGYADISYYEPEIVERSVHPKPIPEMITLLHALKKKGYVLIGATNQDYLQDKVYRRKMKERGADLDELFDAILVTRTHQLHDMNGKKIDENAPYTQVEENVYMINDAKGVKPNKHYYEVLKLVGKKVNPQADLFVHVDDKKENVEGAQQVEDMKGILFNLPAGSARKSTLEQLDAAIQGYKEGLEALGIFADEVGQNEAKGASVAV